MTIDSQSALLAIDTSGSVGSVVLATGGMIIAEVRLERRAEHASRLVPAIAEMLEAAGAERRELSGVAVGSGPGSFTGVRVAAATAKGLTRALGIPLWAVSSLAAAALADETVGIRYALFDARSDRVYGACFDVGAEEVRALREPHAGVLAGVFEPPPPPDTVFVGDGAIRHRSLIEAAGFTVLEHSGNPALARGVVRYLARTGQATPLKNPASWEPTYLRGSGAVAPGSVRT